jgi:hypothetical protein
MRKVLSGFSDVWEEMYPRSVQSGEKTLPSVMSLRLARKLPEEIPDVGYTFDSVINTMLRQYEQVCERVALYRSNLFADALRSHNV